jgi:hypothetical protein
MCPPRFLGNRLDRPADRRAQSTTRRLFMGLRSAISTASIRDYFIAAGAAFAAVGGTLMLFGAAFIGSTRPIWVDVCIDGGIFIVLLGAALVSAGFLGGHVAVGRAWRQHPEAEPASDLTCAADDCAGPALADEVAGQQPPSPLEVKVVDDYWHLIPGGKIWIVGVAVRLTNVSDRPVAISECRMRFGGANGAAEDLPPQGRERPAGVRDLLARAAHEHSADVLAEGITVEPLERVVRWLFTTALVPARHGGRPSFTFSIVDSLGNTYELDQPARRPQRYPMS